MLSKPRKIFWNLLDISRNNTIILAIYPVPIIYVFTSIPETINLGMSIENA